MSLLVCDLTKRFDGLTAVDAVGFTAMPGKVTSIIGPNGAGKTTLLNLVSGITSADSGSVSLYDDALSGRPAHVVAALGLSRTYQSPQLFPGMTVLETVMVGAHLQGHAGFVRAILKGPGTRREELRLEQAARAALRSVGVPNELDYRIATELAYGVQRRVEIARTLAMRAKAILLDEPAAGLNPSETQEISDLIRRLRDHGQVIVLVEHNMDMVMGISDWVVVMNFGRKIAEGPPSSVRELPEVLDAYLGVPEANA